MSKAAKIFCIIGGILILSGLLLFGGVMASLKWDFSKLSMFKYETNTHEITEAFENISVDTKTADIKILPSETGSYSVVCHEQTKIKHAAVVKDGTLSIEAVDTREWYDYIGFDFEKPSVTVYLPEGEYGALSIEATTGDTKISQNFTFESIAITQTTGDIVNYASSTGAVKLTTTTGRISLARLFAKSLDLSVSTGEISISRVECRGDVNIHVSTGDCELTDLSCENLISDGRTGDITLDNVTARNRFSIERSTGDVTLDGSDAAELFIITDTGDVEGSLRSEKVFLINTDTGDKDVPNTTTGGRCEITTDTGDIRLTIKN